MMPRCLILVALLLVITICAVEGSGACKVDFEKVGCYRDSRLGRALPDLLLTNRDKDSAVFSGRIFNWHDFKGSVTSLLCHCSKIAHSLGYRYIGIQYYAECWGGRSDNFTRYGYSKNCMQSYATMGREVCNFDLQADCVGRDYANFVYELGCWQFAVDIAILLDNSNSMKGPALAAAKDFLKNLVDLLKISQHGTHVGLITFTTTAHIEFDFKNPLNSGENGDGLKAVIDGIQSAGGNTNPGQALYLADTKLFSEEGGVRHKVPKFVITITDGHLHQGSLIAPFMLSLKFNKDVNLLSVGVGTNINHRVVNVLAMFVQQNVFDGNVADAAQKVNQRLTTLAPYKCESQK